MTLLKERGRSDDNDARAFLLSNTAEENAELEQDQSAGRSGSQQWDNYGKARWQSNRWYATAAVIGGAFGGIGGGFGGKGSGGGFGLGGVGVAGFGLLAIATPVFLFNIQSQQAGNV
jgi:hypothetical protein